MSTRWAHLSFPGNVCCRPPFWVDGPLRRWNGTFLLQRWLGRPRDATAYPADPNLGLKPPGQRGGFRLPTAEPGRTAWSAVTAHDLSEQGPAASWLTAPPLGDTMHAHLRFQVRSVGDTVSHPRPWRWVHPSCQLPGAEPGCVCWEFWTALVGPGVSLVGDSWQMPEGPQTISACLGLQTKLP